METVVHIRSLCRSLERRLFLTSLLVIGLGCPSNGFAQDQRTPQGGQSPNNTGVSNSVAATGTEQGTKQFDQALAASKARMAAKYPDVKKPGTPLYNRVIAFKQSVQKEHPEAFNNPNWPDILVEQCAKWLIENPTLYTAADIKNYWTRNLPKASSLDSNYWTLMKLHDAFNRALESGSLDAEAQDEADRLNISLLTAAHKYTEAEILQHNHELYQERLAAQQAQEQQAATDAAVISQNAAILDQLRKQASQIRRLDDQTRSQAAQIQREQQQISESQASPWQ